MKKKFSLLLISLFLYSISEVYAQEVFCGFDHQHELMMKNPKAQSAHLNAQKRMKAKNKATTHEGKYIIPVVFHVFGTTFNDGTKVDLALIEDALRKTNEDFQGLTSDYNQTGTSSRFESIKKPLEIEFRLAKIDPSGRATTGVQFFADKVGFGDDSRFDVEIQKYAWDNTKYMNIYIMRDLYADGDHYNSGVSWLPNDWMTSENLARVVYNGSYLGTNTNENFRRVLTHEFGHFMGLHHTFQGGCTMPNDGVEDTPAVATSHWPIDDKNCYNEYTDWENFMNYTEAYRHFTKGQVDLMEKYLSEPARSTLWQKSNLEATGVNDDYIPQPAVIASAKVFTETIDNQGEVEGILKMDTYYGMSFAKTGKAVEGVDYEIRNLPEGLTSYLYISSSSSATLRLNGAANAHAKDDSKSDIHVVLKTGMLKGENIQEQDFDFAVYFNDPYTELCSFDPRFAPCAHISCVKFQQIENYTEFDGYQWKDFSKTHVAGLEVGQTYTFTATVQNWSSGPNDAYKVRLWIDWNGDFILQDDELISTQKINKIGDPGTTHEVTFEVVVPENVVRDREFSLRVMLHYYSSSLESDGMDPCGVIDSGDVEDYGAVIGEGHALPPNNDVEPADEVCMPEISYRPYAFISKVKFNGMVNETEGVVNETYDKEDFRNETSLQVHLEKGKTYELEVTCKNLDSSVDDPYKVRAYIDWNHNNVLEMESEKSEAQKIDIPQIGPSSKPVVATFSFTVPDDAVVNTPLHMRVFLHFGKAASMAGELPCGTVENGQLEDYYVFVDDVSGLDEISEAGIPEIYPNPTEGILQITNTSSVIGYSLFSIDGKLVQQEEGPVSRIDISANAKGMYILKMQTQDGEYQRMVILK